VIVRSFADSLFF